MPNWEKARITDDNFEEQEEKFASFEEHIKSLDKEQKNAEMVAKINGLNNPDNKNLATFLLGECGQDGKFENLSNGDALKIISYIEDFEKTDGQDDDVVDYLRQMIDQEEQISLEPHDEINASLYAYAAGRDVSRQIRLIREKHDNDLSDDDIKDLAVTRVFDEYAKEDNLYFPGNRPKDIEDNKEYITDCYDGYIQSMAIGKKVIASTSE